MDSSASEPDVFPQTLTSTSSSERSSCTPSSDPSPPFLSKTPSFSKLNAGAPEFVPRTTSSSAASSPLLSPTSLSSPVAQGDLAPSFVFTRPPGPPAMMHVYNAVTQVPPPIDGHYGYGYGGQFYGGLGGALDRPHDRLAVSALSHTQVIPSAVQVNSDATFAPASLNNGLPEEAALKLMKQVEFYFSDVNLATTGYLFKIMCKDPEGYVPISVVASIKKIKTLTKSQSQLAGVLRGSSKLVVSDDGKKVRRQNPLTETEMEEVQSRIIIAENLPEDHCHQNLMRIFSAVGSVKSIRTCQPGGPSSTSKTDCLNFSNKLHAFVEYETTDLAEKAVVELNAGDWRNGLKVRLLLKRSTKSSHSRVKRGGQEAEPNFKEEAFGAEVINEFEDPVQLPNESTGEEHSNGKDGSGVRKGRSREYGENPNIGKGRGRQPNNVNNRANYAGTTSNVVVNNDKQPPGPRMPDGTRGFSMGRGKAVAVKTA